MCRNLSKEQARPMGVISLAGAERTRVTRRFMAIVPLRYLFAGIVAGALAVAGCSSGAGGTGGMGGTGSTGTTGSHSHGGSAKVALTFQVKGDAASHGTSKTLTCDPA